MLRIVGAILAFFRSVGFSCSKTRRVGRDPGCLPVDQAARLPVAFEWTESSPHDIKPQWVT